MLFEIKKYCTRTMANRSRFITAPLKNHANFSFYSIFELKFHYKKRKKRIITAVSHGARTVVTLWCTGNRHFNRIQYSYAIYGLFHLGLILFWHIKDLAKCLPCLDFEDFFRNKITIPEESRLWGLRHPKNLMPSN